ncbi:MAG TPA: GGDEF domain-containing response regulator [Gemmatimonadaceae bacterium]|nr:GGDEF domain-containing response regulator [Gemmatimonadaceae bacterium]
MSANGTKILLVSDRELEVPELISALTDGGLHAVDLVRATDADAHRALSDDRYDAMLVSLVSSDALAFDAIARLRDHAPQVPIVVLTAEEDDAVAVRALKAGAEECIGGEQANGAMLVRAIRYAIERHQLQMALRAMALVDDLTGLYNRRGFQTLARQHMKMADRMRKRVSHIFVDLDGLKEINDMLGHREGDLALIETADLLRETFRESDIIARIGGDEFVILALETVGLAQEHWVTRLQENLSRRNEQPDRRYRLSLSMGIAYYDPEFPCPLDDLLDRADALMYEQKRTKRPSSPGGTPAPPTRFSASGARGVAPRAD